MKAKVFKSAAEFRVWLDEHHATERELLVCFYRKASGRGITYLEALDEALCFGWIDGVRKRLDGDTFTVRFTSRNPGSVWSRVNTQTKLDAELEAVLRADRKAASFFDGQPPGYRKLAISWIMSAKKEETRRRRLVRLIECSAKGERIDPLNPNGTTTGSSVRGVGEG